MIFVNCSSHRAREKLARVLGYDPPCYYKSFTSTEPGPHYAFGIENVDLERARTVKGVTVRKYTKNLNRCIPVTVKHGL